jgi:hypothetical protein
MKLAMAIRHAINPRIHVHAIEVREAKDLSANFMEGLPIGD